MLSEINPAKPTYGPDAALDGLVSLYRRFTANPELLGSWTAVDVVPTIDGFVPPVVAAEKRAVAVRNAPIKFVVFRDGGLTDSGTLSLPFYVRLFCVFYPIE